MKEDKFIFLRFHKWQRFCKREKYSQHLVIIIFREEVNWKKNNTNYGTTLLTYFEFFRLTPSLSLNNYYENVVLQFKAFQNGLEVLDGENYLYMEAENPFIPSLEVTQKKCTITAPSGELISREFSVRSLIKAAFT